MPFADIAACGPASELLVHEEGWQSWSPAGTYPATSTSPRPPDAGRRVLGWRPDREQPVRGFQGEGLLAVGPRAEGGEVRIWYAPDPAREVPAIRARANGGRLTVSADGPVAEAVIEAGSMDAALARWADGVAGSWGARPVVPIPAVWCSWYQYFGSVTLQDVVENLERAAALRLAIGVVQVDDGYAAEVGDWTSASPRFGGSLAELAARVRSSGRRAGIWVAPFLASEHSRVADAHPEWMVGGADPGRNWDRRLHVLDVTRAEAAEWVFGCFRQLADWGFDYFKLDFLYAGALPGRRHQDASPLDAYRAGLRLIRAAVGAEATLLGCGAPLLPSVGLVDALRVGPDIALRREPERGDLSSPSQRGAELATRARAFLHGRFWANDPDCLVLRPEMEGRADWARTVERWGGLRSCGDRLAALDGWGLETARRLLRPSASHPLVEV